MSLIVVPAYRQPKISADEGHARAIVDLLDPDAALPQKCGKCGEKARFDNPLMMEPLQRFGNGLPQGTLYRAKCAKCKERAARRR
jgi:hypothetical protein